MVRVVKAVRIYKMGIGTAKLGGPLVHHIGECLDRTCDMLGNGIGTFVG